MAYTDSAADDDNPIDPAMLAPGTAAPTEDDYGISDYVSQQRERQAAQAAAAQAQASAQRASDTGSDDPLMQGLTQRYRPDSRPADRTTGMASDPDAPITADSSMGALLKKAAEEKWARNQANAPESASIPGAISSAWGSIKQKLADYINGTNAAPPHEVDAAMAATQAANPTASTAEVVQKTIAGTADPLSPGYMDQAGRDTLGDLGKSTTTGYAARGPLDAEQAAAIGIKIPPGTSIRFPGDIPSVIPFDPDAPVARREPPPPQYDTSDIAAGTPLGGRLTAPGSGGRGGARGSPEAAGSRAPAAPRAAPARGRRSDAGDGTGAPGPQLAIADSGTMSDASNDVRSTLPADAQVAAAAQQTTGYANQPPSAGGFSGSVGNNVTTIPIRQGAPTPAGAAPATAAPAGPAPTPTYPNGMKLVPTSGGQYDRALVGSDGIALRYIPKGAPAPSSDDAADAYASRNLGELQDRLKRGDPTALAQQYDVSKPLPPAQAATPQSTAAAQAEMATRAAGGRSAPGGQQSNDPVQDLLQRAAQTRDPNAQRMFTNEAYKIQETRRVNQQKSADAALKTFSTGEQNLIKSIYTKENGGNKLTPAEQALKDDYVTRIQQHTRDGGQGGQASQAGGGVPPAAVAALRANPQMRTQFDAKFGQGAAARYIGGQ